MRNEPIQFMNYIILKRPIVMCCDITESDVLGWKEDTPDYIKKEFDDFMMRQKLLHSSKTFLLR